jgi:AraC family L-rhamnose operon transcriptional activator RhaR
LSSLAQHLPVEPTRRFQKPNPSVVAAIKLIDEHPEHGWSLESLAAHVHVLPDYLTRAFSKATGLPPITYLRRRRLETAALLLTRSERTVSEIGDLVGWSDSNYFSRRFHAEFGLTPSAYRKRFANQSMALQQGVPKPATQL